MGFLNVILKKKLYSYQKKISHESWLNIKLFVFTYTFLSFKENFQIFKNKNNRYFTNSFRFVKKKIT